MRKSFKQFLLEAPLPDDWDKDIYNDRIPFNKRVQYAKDRAAKIGTGSSRIAFKIPYQGRDTVLKIAKNKKGMAQNEHEVQALNDYYLNKIGITIPMIDYDEQSATPTWIHMEMARKATRADFKKHTGGTIEDLMAYAYKVTGNKRYPWGNSAEIDEESEFVQSFVDYVGNYSGNHAMGDYSNIENWGVYDDELVIIDIGLSEDIYTTYYSR